MVSSEIPRCPRSSQECDPPHYDSHGESVLQRRIGTGGVWLRPRHPAGRRSRAASSILISSKRCCRLSRCRSCHRVGLRPSKYARSAASIWAISRSNFSMCFDQLSHARPKSKLSSTPRCYTVACDPLRPSCLVESSPSGTKGRAKGSRKPLLSRISRLMICAPLKCEPSL